MLLNARIADWWWLSLPKVLAVVLQTLALPRTTTSLKDRHTSFTLLGQVVALLQPHRRTRPCYLMIPFRQCYMHSLAKYNTDVVSIWELFEDAQLQD